MIPVKKKTRLKRQAPSKHYDPGRFSMAEMESLAERLLKMSDADETEVEIDLSVDALTRFANNTIHQNVAEHTLGISVRLVLDGRTARATTNKTDDDSLRRVIAVASSLARNEPKNVDLMPLLKRQNYKKVDHFIRATAETTPDDRARAVTRVCKFAEKQKQTAAGIFATGYDRTLLANSRGLFARHDHTEAQFSITILEPNSSGWAKSSSADVSEIDPDALAASASHKSATSRNPVELKPGHYTAILEPSATLDFVGSIFYDFSATAVRDKRSCLNDRMDRKVFGENITLWDDVYHPLQIGAPWDGEGLPRQRVLLIERGVPKNLVYSRSSAKKMKEKATGHGFALPNEHGEAPTNLVFAGGDKSVAEMITSTELATATPIDSRSGSP